MAKKVKGNAANDGINKNLESVFQSNSLTNYRYPNHDKAKPRLSETDVECAKRWVDENHK